MAEQQLRRSAEARLCNEIRKSFKLTSYNQDIALANTKLQQQLKEARTEVKHSHDPHMPSCGDVSKLQDQITLNVPPYR